MNNKEEMDIMNDARSNGSNEPKVKKIFVPNEDILDMI